MTISETSNGNDEVIITGDDLIPAIIYVPNHTVKLKLVATIMNDDLKTAEAENTMGLGELREAFIDGNEWEAENVKYVLNPDYYKE